MNQKGQTAMMDGMVKLIFILFVFASVYGVLDTAVNLLQDQAGTTVDLISAGYLPLMAVAVFLAISYFLNPRRREPDYGAYASEY